MPGSLSRLEKRLFLLLALIPYPFVGWLLIDRNDMCRRAEAALQANTDSNTAVDKRLLGILKELTAIREAETTKAGGR